jgi:hypothetical protein
MTAEKPPIGCKPRWLTDEHRAIELVEALHRYLADGRLRKDATLIHGWASELYDITRLYHWEAEDTGEDTEAALAL